MSSARRCVYTVLLGDYELLNEQPSAVEAGIDFICFTDNPDLSSTTWQLQRVEPCFAGDPVRSQRLIKILAHEFVGAYGQSLYIDNSVILKCPAGTLFDAWSREADVALPLHSFRETLGDEFLEVLRCGLDEPHRVMEQYHHYATWHPAELARAPHWTAMLLRNHHAPAVVEFSRVWADHVLRYSRRDQLSFPIALVERPVRLNSIELDNHDSPLHQWPHAPHRSRSEARFSPTTTLLPPVLRLRDHELEYTKLRRTHEQAVARLRELERDAVKLSRAEASAAAAVKREGAALRQVGELRRRLAEREEVLARIRASRSWQLTHLPRTLLGNIRRLLGGEANRLAGKVQEPAFATCRNGRQIAVDPTDERGEQLIQRGGDLNPPSTLMWQELLGEAEWRSVVDIGANYGEMLLNVDLRGARRIVAVEPNPRVLSCLRQSLRGAGLRVRTVRAAVTASTGEVDLLLDRTWSGCSAVAGTGEGNAGHRIERRRVPALSLVDLMRRHVGRSGYPVAMKMDIEGGEAQALRAALGYLSSRGGWSVLTEVLHATPSDRAWFFDHFLVRALDLKSSRLVPVASLDAFEAGVMAGALYPQDVVLGPRAVQDLPR